MAALPDQTFGIDPSTMEPQEMPQVQVDPGAAPADPNLDIHAGDPYAEGNEPETRERVELCLLVAVETCAKAVEAGIGAQNPQFATSFGQAAASLAQAYGALTNSEQKEPAPTVPFPS